MDPAYLFTVYFSLIREQKASEVVRMMIVVSSRYRLGYQQRARLEFSFLPFFYTKPTTPTHESPRVRRGATAALFSDSMSYSTLR